MSEPKKISLTYNGEGEVFVFDREQDKGFYCQAGGSISVSNGVALELLESSNWTKSGEVSDGE